ncbi:MAG TPA: Cof-type HAD-IIB family hydrolase [Opitutaceae bacterium]|nr:Cof-type HAD-IIB family hydrolase [Opitutaceae bacterium]
METQNTHGKLRLAAVDLDGTLLGPDHRISPENHDAVARLQAAGIQVILASGRHYKMMRSFIDALPGLDWVVSVQGAEASAADRSHVMRRSFLDRAMAERIFALNASQRFGFSMLAYGLDDIFALDARAQATYVDLFGYRPTLTRFEALREFDLFKVVWVGSPETLEKLRDVKEVQEIGAQTVRSHQHLLEFVQPGVNKSTGAAEIATRLGIEPASVVAFGDAENDLPLFRWAGRSVAMPHGWDSVKRAASFIAPAGEPESAFARGVDVLLRT